MNKGIVPIIAIIIAVIILAGGIGGYVYFKNKTKPIACTEEAKICPDGSAVGRIGSNCEFAECPTVTPTSTPTSTTDISDWKTYKNDKYGFEIKYPTFFPEATEVDHSYYQPDLPYLKSFGFNYCYDCEKMDKQIFDNICSYDIIINIFNNSSNLSLKDWFQRYGEYFGYSNQVKNEVIIDGVKGIKLGKLGGLPPGGGAIDGLLLIPKDTKIYGISLDIANDILGTDKNYIAQCYSKVENTFNQMVSTFRFLK